ncbi:MAG TPA: hypothetical protein VEH50_08395 [Methylomirabilota bacterium]|nr:hypothetical protein [Methylomirabilota bacterium]
MSDSKESSDRFHPGMPAIPGVSQQSAASFGPAGGGPARGISPRGLRGLILLGVALLLCGVAGLWIHAQLNRHRVQAISTTDPADVLQNDRADAPLPASSEALPERIGPGKIARLDELAKPWSSVVFTFLRQDTHEEVPAIIVRLPGTAERSSSYWAFSLVEPYGKCQLLFVTEPQKLASQFGYTAHHPMVADPCNGAVFDPLGMGVRPDGAWVRGAIVQGGAVRPPISIELSIQGENLYADRIE